MNNLPPLPDGWEFDTWAEEDRIYIKFNGCYVVTKETGARKFFRGRGTETLIRAKRWIWQMLDGYHSENYEIEPSSQPKQITPYMPKVEYK